MLATVTANGEKFSIDLDRLTFAEGRAIERATGQTFGEFGELMKKGSLTAVQAIVWVTVKRSKPETKFSDLDEWALADFEFDIEGAAAAESQDPTPADPAA